MSSTNGSRSAAPSVLIIGAGFGGIGLGIRLKQAGVESFTLLEKADGVGGVWRHNTYPGLTCDVPSHLYSFSFEPKHDWSRRYPRRTEILQYLEDCVDEYGLRPHLRTRIEVTGARFDEESGMWRVRTADGEELESDVLVSATGQLGLPKYPDIPGLERFEGELFHSAHWNHDHELTGKRVASLGTGASAIQYLPEIAAVTEQLYVFQRSPSWVVPKPDRPYRPRQRKLFRMFPWIQAISRFMVFLRFEILIGALTNARWIAAPYRRGYARRLKQHISDPVLREKLLPDFPLGCKRVLISNDYLPMLARPNVDLVTEPVREVGRDRVITGDGVEREVDTIILGTGFQANDFLAPMEIHGRDGRELNEVWRELDGAEAYLGLAVSGFPNMFMLYGPNTNLGAGSIIFMLESQIEFVVAAVRQLAETGARWMEVREEAQTAFNREVQERLKDTVWTAGCASWYRTESGKVVNNWPGFTVEYRRRTRRPDPADFRLAGAPQPAGSGLQAA